MLGGPGAPYNLNHLFSKKEFEAYKGLKVRLLILSLLVVTFFLSSCIYFNFILLFFSTIFTITILY